MTADAIDGCSLIFIFMVRAIPSSGNHDPLISVDFNKPDGKLRHRLHGSGYMPNISRQHIRDFTAEFAAMNLYEARTHDQALSNPGQRVVDTHFVFPNMKADPTNPDNYYFAATDHLLKTCLNCGTRIKYRLGTSIEHTRGRHFNARMPQDFEKYAEVLAGIIRHYNHGWADGYRWTIKYWEVWNEADLGPRMWDGTLEDYYRFYAVIAKRLKEEFPEIMIGGPALSSFKEEELSDLLVCCRENNAPIDFLSWHCYTADVEELVAQPRRGRTLLDSLGFTQTETIINEWHYLQSWEGLHANVTPESYEHAMNGPAGMFGIDSAVFNISVVAAWHDTPLDGAHYYGCGDGTWGFTTMFGDLNRNYHSMCLLGQMMTRFPNRVQATGDGRSVRLLAGTDDVGNCGMLIADYRGEQMEITVDIKGIDVNTIPSVHLLDQTCDIKEIEPTFAGPRLILRKQHAGSGAFFVTFPGHTDYAP